MKRGELIKQRRLESFFEPETHQSPKEFQVGGRHHVAFNVSEVLLIGDRVEFLC